MSDSQRGLFERSLLEFQSLLLLKIGICPRALRARMAAFIQDTVPLKSRSRGAAPHGQRCMPLKELQRSLPHASESASWWLLLLSRHIT